MVTLSNIYLEDNWGDGLLTGRTNSDGFFFEHPRGSQYAGDYLKAVFRPEWATVGPTTPSVAGGEVFFPGTLDRGGIQTSSNFTIGSFSLDMRLATTGSNGAPGFYFMATAPNPDGAPSTNYEIQLGAKGSQRIRRTISGTLTEIIDAAWSTDTSYHTNRATRDYEGRFELFLDGGSQGTTVDNSFTYSNILSIVSNYDEDCYADNLEVR